ncbi:Hypothetical predicted protein [Pelobates cultripes]|uniref:Uncharacterized protein n=1 Tax=Pelobates cultripes TaxID=61616 RepID=A0AAD1T0D9_PELCU|nr:Hypothetical predicted protein [Pelobates cultripes]
MYATISLTQPHHPPAFTTSWEKELNHVIPPDTCSPRVLETNTWPDPDHTKHKHPTHTRHLSLPRNPPNSTQTESSSVIVSNISRKQLIPAFWNQPWLDTKGRNNQRPGRNTPLINR